VSSESRRLAGLLLVILPTVMVGGVSIRCGRMAREE
jgi:hypothetical protein